MKNSFTVQLAVRLFFLQVGLPPFLSAVLNPFATAFLGAFVDYGILNIDLTINALKRGMKLKEFYKAAKAAHDRATARVYTEDGKREIRKQYRDALRGFVRFSRGMRDN